MRITRLALVLMSLILVQSVWAASIGVSTYPLRTNKKMVTAEMAGIISTGGGIGFVGRYSQKINRKLMVDAGLGISEGEYASQLFAGADYELYQDYMKQPRISLKAMAERRKVGDISRNHLAFAPTVSKGFSFWGHPGHPFVSLPIGIALHDDTKTYETTANITAGVVSKLPFKFTKNLTANLEGSLSLKDSYSVISLGISYPMN